jgi:hypothetical protein
MLHFPLFEVSRFYILIPDSINHKSLTRIGGEACILKLFSNLPYRTRKFSAST